MDSTIINIRILSWHLMVDKDTFALSVSRNDWHETHGWPDGYFSVYNFFGYGK